MPELVIRPMQWSALPPLHEAPPLDGGDVACLHEIQAVLARHGKLDRFAIHLAHSHFELAPDEVLIERPDPDGRTQHVTVGRLEDEPAARPTTWLFDEGPELRLSDAVYCVCVSDPGKTDACARHGKSSSPSKSKIDEDRAALKRISEDAARHEQGFPVGGGRGRERNRRDDN